MTKGIKNSEDEREKARRKAIRKALSDTTERISGSYTFLDIRDNLDRLLDTVWEINGKGPRNNPRAELVARGTGFVTGFKQNKSP
ncbi:MAG: hypothetical protein AAF442_05120 [Pseudomonadota bacterium]